MTVTTPPVHSPGLLLGSPDALIQIRPWLLTGWLSLGLGVPVYGDDYPVGDARTMWEYRNLVGSYRHWNRIFPVRRVSHAPGRVSGMPRGVPLGNLTYPFNGEQRILDNYIARARTTGLIVLKNGEIRLERYAHGADETSLFTSQSVAKSVVSMLVGMALADGLIESLDDPVDRYVAELTDSGYADVPIESILQMSSGIAFVEQYTNALSDSQRLWSQTVQYRTRRLNDFLLDLVVGRAPYEEFNYKGVDTAALGWMVTRVSGLSLSDYLSIRLWQPLGMEADASWGLDGEGPDATEIAFCCFNARLRDYARLGQFMLQRGLWAGQQLLPDDWVERATVSSREKVKPGQLYPGYALGYQYQWWTFPGEEFSYTAEGINGQFLYVNPAEQLVVVMTSAWRRFWDSALEAEFYAIIDAVRKLTQFRKGAGPIRQLHEPWNGPIVAGLAPRIFCSVVADKECQ